MYPVAATEVPTVSKHCHVSLMQLQLLLRVTSWSR
jgi:hypothetical protein